MRAPPIVLLYVIDHDGPATLPNLIADRGFHLEFASWLESEIYFIQNAAGDPPVFGDAGNGGKSHSCCTADYFKNGGNGIYPAYFFDVGL
jgi:hypothetical protein